MKKVRIGTSGWSYAHWDPSFYGEIPASEKLAHYSQIFNTVEINTTFYHSPKISTIKAWVDQVPKSFVFSVKASRFITHIKRLNHCQSSVKILNTQLRSFKTKLGPILFQFPPSFKKDIERLKEFIPLLNRKYRYVFEFRSDSWFDEEVYDLLRSNNFALCISELNGKLSPIEITGDFVYIRLHGPAKSYKGIYGKRRLNVWAKRIKEWKVNKRVFIYFDNDEKGYAVQDARTLIDIESD